MNDKMLVISGDVDWARRCEGSEVLTYKQRLIEAFELFPDAALAEGSSRI